MQTKGRLFDDLARVANGAAGTFSGVRHEIEGVVKQRLERVLADMDVVTRDEFETVKEVTAKARLEQETLQARVDALEAKLADVTKTAPAKRAAARKTPRGTAKSAGKKTAAKTAAKKTAAKKTPAKKATPPAE